MGDKETPENDDDGGDISSGFGTSEVSGPVSDEKAQRMLHDPPQSDDEDGDASPQDPTGD